MKSESVESAPSPDTLPSLAPTDIVHELASNSGAALRFARRIADNAQDAEDIVQIAYLRLLRIQNRLRPGPGARALLLRYVLTAGANFYTSKKRRQAREGAHIRNSETVCSSDYSKDNLCAAVERAMQTLDDNLRLPLSLHYQQGLSYAEAAQLLNVPENSLRVYAQRGIQRLRDKLTREGFSAD